MSSEKKTEAEVSRQQSAEQRPAKQQSAKQQSAEQQPAEKQSAEQQPAEKQSAEQQSATYQQHRKIRGWLLVALILLTLGACYNLYNLTPHIVYFKALEYYHYHPLFGISSLILISLFELRMIYKFIKFKPDAFFLGEMMFYIVISQNIISVLLSPIASNKGVIGFAVNSFMQAVWFFYLQGSLQVKRLYPEEERKPTKADWVISAIAFFVPLICLALDFFAFDGA
jgi:cation transport ATPase